MGKRAHSARVLGIGLTAGLLAMLAPANAAANLVTNASFEAGFTGWTVTGSVPMDATGVEGTTHGALAAVFGGGSAAAGDAQIAQVISTVIGVSYTLDFDYGAFGQPSQPQALRVEVLGTTTLVDQTLPDNGTGFVIASFDHYQFGFTADSVSTTLRFSDVSAAGGASADGVLDSVQLVTEPALGLLLALALTAGLQRR